MLFVCLLPAVPAFALTEPVGVWSCLVFGDEARGDERMSLVLTSLSSTFVSVQGPGGPIAWRRIGDWDRRRREASFVDVLAGRIYTADLDYSTLGGTWSERGADGGWWCARRSADPAAVQLQINGTQPEFYVPPLVPDLMASPRYPRQAIREAREGEAVVCFLVDRAGQVHDPVVVTITDDIFEATTLSAIGRSRYRPTARYEGAFRPGCRSYTYTLDLINE